ncbi:MAG: TRAP transporter small permease subunit [Gammaproteobacteria bacterium]|nr:MAG: TRAP transporter small permease subunit [Gammaproteobacteria bacterium]
MSDASSDFCAYIDRISEATGRAASWLTLAMVLVTLVIVVMRYVFDVGLIWLQESLTWMHAVVFMVGAAYTMQQEQHVRVDIFYRELSERRRAWVNLLGVTFFVFPMCAFFVWSAWGYAAASWSIGEVSRNAGGLPFPFVPLLKSVLIIMPLAVALQGLSWLLRSMSDIRRR